MKTKRTIWLAVVVMLVTGLNAGAELSLLEILDGITVDPVGDSHIDDMLGDALLDADDSYWSITATGGSISTVIIEFAAYAGKNTFGIYDMEDPSKKVQVFAGAASTGDMAAVSIRADGSVWLGLTPADDTGIDFSGNAFGFYLDSSHADDGGLWFSDTSENSDGMDHMLAYQGNGTDKVQIDGGPIGFWTVDEYVLAFEDLQDRYSDHDYNDFVVMVESISQVPNQRRC